MKIGKLSVRIEPWWGFYCTNYKHDTYIEFFNIHIHYNKRISVLCCPCCKMPFSSWFEWNGLMYCYPCYGFGTPKNKQLNSKMITEKEGVFIKKKRS